MSSSPPTANTAQRERGRLSACIPVPGSFAHRQACDPASAHLRDVSGLHRDYLVEGKPPREATTRWHRRSLFSLTLATHDLFSAIECTGRLTREQARGTWDRVSKHARTVSRR